MKKTPLSINFRRAGRKRSFELSPDEIFLDSRNLPGFDRNQMEGRLVQLLSKRVAFFVFIFFICVELVMFVKLWGLQIRDGALFRARAFSNSFESFVLSPERGIIYDRNGKELAWNEPRFQILIQGSDLHILETIDSARKERFFPDISFDTLNDLEKSNADVVVADELLWEDAEKFIEAFPDMPFRVEASSVRSYIPEGGFSHLIGYTALPETGAPFQVAGKKTGKTGIEKYFDEILRGKEGIRFAEADAVGKIVSENIQQKPQNGESLELTIDAGAQAKLYSVLGKLVEERGFHGGAGVVLDVETGEVLAITSYPEFDLNEFSHGISQESFSRLARDTRAPFFARAFEGVYVPGSIFKPVLAVAALAEGIISPEKKILSTGSISIPNPYFPDKPSIFRDWKAHGWVDMRTALAVSSDVYFYTIGGGFGDQKGLGANRIEKYAYTFGFGAPVFEGIDNASGNVPHPEGNDEWRIGDTYHFSIGQEGLQATPIQIARFIAILANNGKVPPIHITKSKEAEELVSSYPLPDIDLPQEYFQVIQEGLHRSVKEGTAIALSSIGIDAAGKTGTAELGNKRVNSWLMGYAPFNHPRVAFAIVLESGDEKNLVGAASASQIFMQWLVADHPEYFK